MQFVNDQGETFDFVFPQSQTHLVSDTHTTGQVVVDNPNNDQGHIKIDGDQQTKLIHIQQNLPDTSSYINCEDHNGNIKFQVLGNGEIVSGTTSTNTTNIAANATSLTEDATAITNNYNTITAHTTSIGTNTTQIGVQGNTIYTHGTMIDDLLAITNDATHLPTEDTLVQRDANADIHCNKLTCADYQWTNFIQQKQIDSNPGVQVMKPVEFDEQVLCTESFEALADGQFLWVPYDDGPNNTMIAEPNAIFRFGRSENIGDSTGADDGILMSRSKDVGASAKQHVIAVSPYNEGANLRISSTKVGADAPYLVCTDSDGIEIFKITKTGQIQSNGVLNNDHTTLPDGNHADQALGNNSLYIGEGKVSFDGSKFIFRRLKDQTVPTALLAAPYSLTAANLPASGNHSIQKWMDLARVAHLGAGNSHLKIKEAFPLANESADFEEIDSVGSRKFTELDETGTPIRFRDVNNQVDTLFTYTLNALRGCLKIQLSDDWTHGAFAGQGILVQNNLLTDLSMIRTSATLKTTDDEFRGFNLSSSTVINVTGGSQNGIVFKLGHTLIPQFSGGAGTDNIISAGSQFFIFFEVENVVLV